MSAVHVAAGRAKNASISSSVLPRVSGRDGLRTGDLVEFARRIECAAGAQQHGARGVEAAAPGQPAGRFRQQKGAQREDDAGREHA